jgi:hypothetical protein
LVVPHGSETHAAAFAFNQVFTDLKGNLLEVLMCIVGGTAALSGQVIL